MKIAHALPAFALAHLVLIGCGSGSAVHGSTRAGFATFPPSLTALAPNSSPVNSVPFTMTVSGSNFTPDATVFWNGTPQQTAFVNANELMVAVTHTDLMFAGFAQIYVRTAGMNSNTVNFNVSVQ